MAIKSGEAASANEVSTELGLSKTTLQLIRKLDASHTLTASDFDNVTWDTYKDETKIDTLTQVLYHAGSIQLDIDTTAELQDYDLTGADFPAGYTNTTETGATIGFDAGNDEVDFAVSTSGDQGRNCNIENDTTYTDGMFKIGLERISLGGQTGASNSLALSRGADSITIRWTEAGGVTTVFDSEGATPVNITGEGTVWLKMTVKPNGAIKTEYSIVGDSSYNTLSDNSSGGVVTAAKPKFTLSSSSTPGFSSSTSVSMVEWKVFGGYHTSGFVVSDAVTAGDTIIAGMLNYTATTPASTSISAIAASADNGANYEAHTLNTFHNFTDQGTQLKTKITLASSDNTATPVLQFYGYQWTEGE